MKFLKKFKKIQGDASFRKFYRNKKNNSIVVVANKEKNKNLLTYDAINKILIKNKILAPKLLNQNYFSNYIEIQDLGNMLNAMGAKIKGIGTSKITITGVEKLNGCIHSAIPDRIEAGTFLIAAAITRSSLLIGPVIPNHLKAVINTLRKCGCVIKEEGNFMRIIPGEIKGVDIKTSPFPGFPTDL